MEEGKLIRPPKEIIEGFKAIPTTTVSDVLDSMGICGIVNGLHWCLPGLWL
jgi:hypothetical protein